MYIISVSSTSHALSSITSYPSSLSLFFIPLPASVAINCWSAAIVGMRGLSGGGMEADEVDSVLRCEKISRRVDGRRDVVCSGRGSTARSGSFQGLSVSQSHLADRTYTTPLVTQDELERGQRRG
jgi:hypothetical protein